MQAVIVHDDFSEVNRFGRALSRRGFMVTSCSDQQTASQYVRRRVADLLILKHRMEDRYTTSVAPPGEFTNPRIATIVLSDWTRQRALDLFELVPSLHAVLQPAPDADVLAALGVQAVQNPLASLLVLSPQNRIARPIHKKVA